MKDANYLRAIDELSKEAFGNSAMLFVGSGISVPSRLPTWSGLLTELIDILSGTPAAKFNPNLEIEARELLKDRSKWLLLAQLLRSELTDRFFTFINERFTDRSIVPNIVHDAIWKINWRGIITTNYDDLIEKSYAKYTGGTDLIAKITYETPGTAASAFRRGLPFVLKAHGDAQTPDTVILTERDYRELIYVQRGLQTLLQTFFCTTSILFIGTSVNDPDIRMLLGFIHSAFHGDTPTHYALIPDNERLNVEDKLLFDEFRIHTIPIPASSRSDATIEFLADLHAAIEVRK
jgi:hypothetical protein